jgi:hypothetical protein
MTAAESKDLKIGIRVFWRGDASPRQKNKLTHRSAPPNHVLKHETRTARSGSQLFEAPFM